MIELQQPNFILKKLFLTLIIGFLAACSGLYRQPATPFETAQVTDILFTFAQSASFGASLPEQDIAAKVAANLAEWGYSISANPESQASHNLTVEIGTISHQATPVGFSFSAGNSDPRALDFQKSDVLPITCVLSPKAQPQHRAELSMSFVGDVYIQDTTLQSDNDKLIALLENDISTVCFNLLSELNVPTQQSAGIDTSNSKPGWIPEIRLEVENDPETVEETTLQPESSDSVTQPQPKKQSKRIIIHNQGSPVIFKFGHERK